MNETIEWISVETDLPDGPTTVLLFCADAAEPVWPGWYQDDHWYSADGGTADAVTHWADLPTGPKK